MPHGMGGTPMTKTSELYACLYVREFPAQSLLRLRAELHLVARAHDGSMLCCCMIRDLVQNHWQMAGLYD
jgi:hypothetical protein